jgi:hypothetical protein
LHIVDEQVYMKRDCFLTTDGRKGREILKRRKPKFKNYLPSEKQSPKRHLSQASLPHMVI